MHPSLPPRYGRRWKEMQGTPEMMMRKNRKKRNTDHSRNNKRSLNTQPMGEKISSNRQNKKSNSMQNLLKDCEKSSKFVTDDVLRSFGVLASDHSVSFKTDNSIIPILSSFIALI